MMAGGGGGGQSTTTQSIPDELKPLASAYTNKAINLSNQGFQPYGGQRYADLNTTQSLGIGMIQDRALNGGQTLGAAEGALGQMIGGGSNPYLDSMVNKAQGNVLANANAAAARSGSFGNSGIAEQAAKQMSDVATSMYGGAYESDANRRLQAIGMAPQINAAGFDNANQMLRAGHMMQDQQQQNLDFNYGQFQEAQIAGMAGVFGSNLGGTSTTTQSGGGK
jgi:hypothetical protein